MYTSSSFLDFSILFTLAAITLSFQTPPVHNVQLTASPPTDSPLDFDDGDNRDQSRTVLDLLISSVQCDGVHDEAELSGREGNCHLEVGKEELWRWYWKEGER